ncbi:hypothetical protein FPV67DRAFT_306746 [Lyophyllum atratum]|nr:hypothetical protein FPV67DRAFT_306746 [Lyophyllum atratum]
MSHLSASMSEDLLPTLCLLLLITSGVLLHQRPTSDRCFLSLACRSMLPDDPMDDNRLQHDIDRSTVAGGSSYIISCDCLVTVLPAGTPMRSERCGATIFVKIKRESAPE